MIFDKDDHKQLILALIDKTQFPGSVLEVAAELKAAVQAASIVTEVVHNTSA